MTGYPWRNSRRLFARQRGLSLVETAGVLGVASIVMGMFANQMADNADTLKAKGVAEKMVEVHAAAQDYIKAKNTDLLAAVGTEPVVIPVGRPDPAAAVPSGPSGLPSLQGAGLLPPNFIDRNGYNQRHALIVKKVTVSGVDRIEGVVTTYGGQPIPNRQLGRIAGFVGASGGYVAPSGDQIVGLQGGWSAQTSDWGSAPETPTVGSVVATTAYANDAVINDYLYRNNIGIPEANRMQTAIDMGGNNVDNASRVNTQSLVAGTSPGAIPSGTKVYTDGDIRGINVWAAQTVNATDVVATGSVTANTIEANNSIVGSTFYAQNGADVGSLTSRGAVSATGQVSGGSVTSRGGVSAVGNISSSGGGITAAGNISSSGGGITAAGNIQAGGNVVATGRVTAQDVDATYLDATTIVYGTRWSKSQGKTLESVMGGKEEFMEDFLVQPTNYGSDYYRAKPNCGSGRTAKADVITISNSGCLTIKGGSDDTTEHTVCNNPSVTSAGSYWNIRSNSNGGSWRVKVYCQEN